MLIVLGIIGYIVGISAAYYLGKYQARKEAGIVPVTIAWSLSSFDLWQKESTRKNSRSHTTINRLFMHYLEWCRIREEKPMLRSAFRDKCREVFDVTAANRATGTQLIP